MGKKAGKPQQQHPLTSNNSSAQYRCFTCDGVFDNASTVRDHAATCRGKQPATASTSSKKVSHLPGFVPATALTKDRMRVKEVVVDEDVTSVSTSDKGKSRAVDSLQLPSNGQIRPHPGLGIRNAPVSTTGASSSSAGGSALARTISAQSGSTSSSSGGAGAASGSVPRSPSESAAAAGAAKKARRKAKKAEAAAAAVRAQSVQLPPSASPADALQVPGQNGDPKSPDELASSAASSTDELPFVAATPSTSAKLGNGQPSVSSIAKSSADASNAIPNANGRARSTSPFSHSVSPAIAAKASPFTAVVSPFDYIASRSPFVRTPSAGHSGHPPPSIAPAPQQGRQQHVRTESAASSAGQSEATVRAVAPPTGIARVAVEPPTPDRKISWSSTATEPARPLPPPLISASSGKRVPQSPLLWSSGASPASLSAPTFGSPLLPQDQAESEAEAYEKAIIKAANMGGREKILAALKEKTDSERRARGEPEKKERVRRPPRPATEPEGKQAEGDKEDARLELERKREELQRLKDGLPPLDPEPESAPEQGEEPVHLEAAQYLPASPVPAAPSSSAEEDSDGVKRVDQLHQGTSLPSDRGSYPHFQLYPPSTAAYNSRTWNTDAHPGLSADVVSQMDSISAARQARQFGTTASTSAAAALTDAAERLQNGQEHVDAASVQGSLPARLPAEVTTAGESTTDATATTTMDEDDGSESETDSNASVTSHLLRVSVRSVAQTRGWRSSATSSASVSRWVLEQSILELNRRHSPSPLTLQKRRELMYAVRKKLNGLLPEWRPDFQYQIAAFGSTAYGLDTDTSDLDLCIIDPKRPEGFRSARDLYDIEGQDAQAAGGASTDEEQNFRWGPQDRKTELGLDAIYEVRRLAGLLRRMGCKDVVPIPSAGVPIVKFKSADGIKADMNANEQLGVRNSALIARYVRFSPIVRPFLIFLKTWAKQRGLNDPSGSRGPMSLSSYSLLLMGIGYLQHKGVVPNLQDPKWLAASGQEREAFWTKVPNKNAIRPGARGRGRFLGDFKAMSVETSFVKAWNKEWDWKPSFPPNEGQYNPHPASSGISYSRSPQPKRTGWDTDDTAPATTAEDSAEGKETHLVALIEGFFDYYLAFPLEDRAVSIWAGKPLQRDTGYLPLAADENGQILPQLPKVTREEREELYEAERDDEAEELLFPAPPTATAPPQAQTALLTPIAHVPNASASPNATDDESAATQARLKKLEELLVAHGVEPGLSFEERHKLERTSRAVADQAAAALEAAESSFPEPSPAAATATGIAAQLAKMSFAPASASKHDSDVSAPGASSMLELHHAQTGGAGGAYLFPFPEREDPESFTEPPHWTQRLVVQDPFIHTRNTCLNIIPRVVDRILVEMHRAHELLQEGAPLEEICLSIGKDEVYGEYAAGLSGAINPSRAARRLQKEQREKEQRKRKEQKKARRAERVAEFQRKVAAGEVADPNSRAAGSREYKKDNHAEEDAKGDKATRRRNKGKERWDNLRKKKKDERLAERNARSQQQQQQPQPQQP